MTMPISPRTTIVLGYAACVLAGIGMLMHLLLMLKAVTWRYR